MSMRTILDSSPLRLPDQRTDSTALKRSASTASLPTPPRTVRKRARSRGSAADSSDEEEDAALPVLSSDFEVPPDAGHKRRRVDAVAAALTEDAFWLDLPAADASTSNPASSSKPHAKASEKPRAKATERAQATRIPRPRRVPGADKVRPRAAAAARIAAQSKASAFSLLTPPASRHRPPATPRPRKAKGMPVRDSPHNPFLAPASPRPSPPRPSAAQRAEQPTLTYVFRGKKQEFVNPHYGAGRSARAGLPVSHPDFSPSDNCTPRRLFAPRAGRAASPDLWESEEEGEGEGPRMTLAAEFARVGEAGGGRGLLERVLEGEEE